MIPSRRCVLLILPMIAVHGFTPPSVRKATPPPTAMRRNMMIAPDQLPDLVSQADSALTASTQWLAEAAVAVAAAAKTEGNDVGLWESYVNIFKIALELVHSTIDGPLRSIGLDQTWGVSIFVFTACK
jgi:hypothetical protein